jgi:uncharacterized membrane protein
MSGQWPVGDLLWGASWGRNATFKEGLSRHLSALTRTVTILVELCCIRPLLNESGEQG